MSHKYNDEEMRRITHAVKTCAEVIVVGSDNDANMACDITTTLFCNIILNTHGLNPVLNQNLMLRLRHRIIDTMKTTMDEHARDCN